MSIPIAVGSKVVFTLALLTAATVEAKELRVDYADQLKPLLALEEPRFSRLQGVFALVEEDSEHACPGVSVSLINAKEARELAVAADGRVDIPIRRALADSGAELLLKKPDDAPPCQFIVAIAARPETRQEMPYAELVALSEQMQAFVESNAGVLSMFAPDVEGLVLKFAPGSSARLTVNRASGAIDLEAKDARIELRLDTDLRAENPVVRWSEPVLAILPLLD